MKHFALTGGIGSGKSTVLSMFKNLGIPTFSADDSAKHAMQHDSSLIHEIKQLLGENAYKNGVLDSAFVAEQVFFDSDKLAALNAIVHPAAKAAYASWCKQQTAPFTVYEFPLVFELGAADRFEGVILITSPKLFLFTKYFFLNFMICTKFLRPSQKQSFSIWNFTLRPALSLGSIRPPETKIVLGLESALGL